MWCWMLLVTSCLQQSVEFIIHCLQMFAVVVSMCFSLLAHRVNMHLRWGGTCYQTILSWVCGYLHLTVCRCRWGFSLQIKQCMIWQLSTNCRVFSWPGVYLGCMKMTVEYYLPACIRAYIAHIFAILVFVEQFVRFWNYVAVFFAQFCRDGRVSRSWRDIATKHAGTHWWADWGA